MSHFHRSSNMVAEHGRVSKRRAAWRIITGVELASRRQTTYATEYEEVMAESSASWADEVKAAVVSDTKARTTIEGQSSDLIANIDALWEITAAVELFLFNLLIFSFCSFISLFMDLLFSIYLVFHRNICLYL